MKKTKVRRVFGRVEKTLDGKRFRIELRKNGAFVRMFYGRRWFVVSLDVLIETALGQRLLPLD